MDRRNLHPSPKDFRVLRRHPKPLARSFQSAQHVMRRSLCPQNADIPSHFQEGLHRSSLSKTSVRPAFSKVFDHTRWAQTSAGQTIKGVAASLRVLNDTDRVREETAFLWRCINEHQPNRLVSMHQFDVLWTSPDQGRKSTRPVKRQRQSCGVQRRRYSRHPFFEARVSSRLF
jgi:hypothetical protein